MESANHSKNNGSENREEECFDIEFLEKYETDDNVRKKVNRHCEECEACAKARYVWLSFVEGQPDPSGDPEYEKIADEVYKRIFGRKRKGKG